MKKLITAVLLSILTLNIYAQNAQDAQKKVIEEPLVIHSSHGRIEIKNSSTCTQHRSDKVSIAIICENQCKQTTDSKDGKVLIQC